MVGGARLRLVEHCYQFSKKTCNFGKETQKKPGFFSSEKRPKRDIQIVKKKTKIQNYLFHFSIIFVPLMQNLLPVVFKIYR